MLAEWDRSNETELQPQASLSAVDHARLGAQLLKQGQVTDAARAFEQAVGLRPEWAEAHNGLSVALRLAQRLDEAARHCREAVRLAPGMAEAHNNLGSILLEQGRIDASIESFSEALRLKPDFANAHSNLGIAHYREQRYTEAVSHYRRAIALAPLLAEAHNNLASALFDLGQGDEALESFAEAIRLKPDYREPHWGRALIWLGRGDFERGWSEFEWRLSPADTSHARPRWDGSNLAGRTILLESEQGLGDTLQFIRFAALLRRQGAKVILACQPRLLAMLARGCPGVDRVVAQGDDLPPFDVHAPLLSLPGILGTTLTSVPADVPYLHPDPLRVERWRAELSGLRGLKIGIAWQGRPDYRGDRARSIPLAEFEPLARVPGVHLISLQKGPGTEQLPPVRRRFPVLDFGDRLDTEGNPFLDTAALMQCLDLVVSCDSALCHLAGAMGVNVWVALSAVPDWRWLLGRDDSPWYPTMRLFRQAVTGQWSIVLRRIADEVAELPPPPPRPVHD